MGKTLKLPKYWSLLTLFLLAFLLRIFKIEDLFYFTYDESIPAFVGRGLILWQHIPLIGGVTPFNFHLGPYFYWFYAFLLAIGKLNPIIWGYTGAAIAIFTTFLIYKLGDTIGSKKLAITATILWTTSYLANIYDRHLWALYWSPLISIIILISLYKIITSSSSPTSSSVIPVPHLSFPRKRESIRGKLAGIHFKAIDKFTYLLGATIALAIHADPSNLVFLVLAFVVWAIYKLTIKKSTFVALGLILFSFLPLVIFDLRHDFANTRPVIEFWSQGRNNPGFEPQKFIDNSLLFPRAFTRLIYKFGDNQIAKQYSYCRTYVKEKFNVIPQILVIICSLALLIFVAKNLKKNYQNPLWHLVSLLLILYFLGIQAYGTIFRADIFEHYITGLFAVFLIIFARIISLLPQKLWLVFLAIFVTFNLYKLALAQNSQGLKTKRLAIEYSIREVGDRPFSLDSLSTCWKYNGYRYLFTVFGREPVKSYVDPNLAYLYGRTQIADKHPETVVAFVVHDFVPETEEFYNRYALLKSHEVKSVLFGNIEVIIMDNSTGWFDKS